MKLIIDIPGEIYREKLINMENDGNIFITELINAVKNGTRLEAQPTDEIKEAYLKGYEYGVKDWFKSKTQPCEDCISRKAVIEYITANYGFCHNLIDEIKAMPPVTPKGVTVTDFADRCRECGRIKTSEDAVSREALIDKATSWDAHFTDSERAVSLADIMSLPSVTPERPKGKWIYQLNRINLPICSECDNPNEFGKEYKFCPNCGAYMRGGGEK